MIKAKILDTSNLPASGVIFFDRRNVDGQELAQSLPVTPNIMWLLPVDDLTDPVAVVSEDELNRAGYFKRRAGE